MDLSQDDISNMEFGLDYAQLGTLEKEWVDNELNDLAKYKIKIRLTKYNIPKILAWTIFH